MHDVREHFNRAGAVIIQYIRTLTMEKREKQERINSVVPVDNEMNPAHGIAFLLPWAGNAA